MNAGCPLAVSDLPFGREVAGPAAVYFDPLAPHSLAQCVIGLISRPELAQRLKAEAAIRKSAFEPKTVAEQIASIIEAAAQRP